MEPRRGAQVHVRFLNCLHKDHYILVDETEIDDANNRRESTEEQKILREKDIFLRAALQLIDQKQTMVMPLPTLRNNVSSKTNLTVTHNDPSSTPAKPQSQEENSMHDVIRLGYLKKSARGGAMNLTQGSSLTWRRKYVELRHGLFSYGDYHGHGHQSGRFDVEELNKVEVNNGVNLHRRTIPLSVSTCSCRVIPLGNCPDNVVFEIAVANGPKRIWMASTVEECKEWVRAINSAMVGGLYSNISTKLSVLSEQGSITPPTDEGRGLSRKLSGTGEMMGLFAYNGINSNGHDFSKIPIDRDPNSSPATFDRYGIGSNVTGSSSFDDKSWASIDGAAAPYVADMSLFLQLQEAFSNSEEEKEIRHVLHSLFTDGTKLTIPVLFIKSKTTHSNFILSAQDQLSVHTIRSKANQIWKDLQRDRIIVNGEEVSGELGAERMLGALVRHLAEKADWIKAKQDKLNTRKPKLCPMELSTTALLHPQPQSQQQQPHTPFTMEFAVSEAQIVECAKDLLVLCNRTQSGGDTYFCIEALLSGEHMKEMCILTPYSAEAEPLQFKIDIVEISQHLSSQQRKRSNTAPVPLPEFMTTSSSAQKDKLVLRQLLASSSDVNDGNDAEDEQEALITDALTTPPAMRSLPPLPVTVAPSSGRIKASTKRSFTFQEIENDLLIQQQQSQLQQQALDHRPIRSSSLASNSSAPSSSNNDGMSSTPSVPLSTSTAGIRRPQLDLKRDVEIENLLGGSVWTSNTNGKVVMVTTQVHSSANQSPAMSSHPSRPSLAGSDEKKANSNHSHQGLHVANSQDVSVDSQQETAVVFRDHPHNQYSNQQLTEGLELHQSQQQRGDDYSVISELTFDTYLKHQNGRNGRPNSQDSNKDPLTSGDDEDDIIVSGHDHSHEDEVIVQSKSAKHKSLLKRIGHKLKPFKMPNMHLAEGFEGMKSPFRPKRATTDPLTYANGNNHQNIATTQSNEIISSSGVHSGAGNISQQSTHKEPFHGIFSHISPRPMFTTRNSDHDNINNSPSSAHITNNNADHNEGGAINQPRLALRVQVRAFSQYRICSANPTGIESIDSWATVAGTFYQSFLLVGDGKGQLGMADRLVTIEVDGCNRMLSEDAIMSLETGMQQREVPHYLSGEEVDVITTAVLN